MEHKESPDHYDAKYDSKRRFVSYWYQIGEVLKCKPARVLEIGIGNNFVARYLREKGLDVTTVDHDERLHPDVVADIRSLPFEDRVFDVVTAYEVIEHLEYKDFPSVLKELARVSSKKVIISLPDATRVGRIEFPIPGVTKIQLLVTVPLFPRSHSFTKGGHFWEIGKKDYPLSRVLQTMKDSGLILESTYRVYENPHHRFFVLKRDTN
ncbi:MAG: methyltransferase domain-containing protein [Patescibacteria group bacterium]